LQAAGYSTLSLMQAAVRIISPGDLALWSPDARALFIVMPGSAGAAEV
jgi:hypothetical protein